MERKLAAILVADMVGYSGMMERDEADTFERLRAHRRELADPAIAGHRGRIFKLTGDGFLVEFGSVVDAVECAAAIQRGMAGRNQGVPDGKRIDLRIGVHVGDVIVEDEDRHGDAVNIAARLQQVAEPGGICVSRTVVDQVRQKVAFGFESRGEEKLKNIAEPLGVFRLRIDPGTERARPSLALPDKPSIAVLPFQNMSGDIEQEYFADGMVEEIITALSRIRWLFVIARNSSFTYKGRAVDVKQVGRELGVRYVLEGSVRKAGNRVRITGQLIDAETGAHLWADRFDGALEDVFDLQDQVTANVVGSIGPKLEQVEIDRAMRKPTGNLDAYDYYLHGLSNLHLWTHAGNDRALADFRRAFDLDPGFAAACGMAARCYAQRKTLGGTADRTGDIAEAARLARRAAELGRDDAVALAAAGFALADAVGEVEDGAALIDKALLLNPNLASAWYFSGWVRLWLGEPEAAIECATRAMRLSPHDPHMFLMQSTVAMAHFFAGRYGQALAMAETALREKPDAFIATSIVVASHVRAGEMDRAREAMARLRILEPDLRFSSLEIRHTIGRREDFAAWADALRRAGLPE